MRKALSKVGEVVIYIFVGLYELVRYNLSSIMKLIFIIGTAAIIQRLTIPLVEAARGYKAIGGEYLIFPLICLLGYFMLFTIPEKFEWFD